MDLNMTTEKNVFGAKMFSALANPGRLLILKHLAQGPSSVNDIAKVVGIKQSITSQHLSILASAGLVVFEKSGNSHLYRLRGPRIARILELMEEFYEIHLEELHSLLSGQPARQ